MIIFHLTGKRIPSLIAQARLTGGKIERALKYSVVTATDIAALMYGDTETLLEEFDQLLTAARKISGIRCKVTTHDVASFRIQQFSEFMEKLRGSESRIY